MARDPIPRVSARVPANAGEDTLRQVIRNNRQPVTKSSCIMVVFPGQEYLMDSFPFLRFFNAMDLLWLYQHL